MTTSGTATLSFDLVELFEEAFERCGREMRTGYEMRTARRSLNLLTIEWANRGINLWTVEQGQIPLVAGQAVYPLPADTIDLFEHVIRTGTGTNQFDISLSRISAPDYATIAAKNSTGRPIQMWFTRQSGETDGSITTLQTAATATDTTLSLVPTASFASTVGLVQIDSETIAYSGVDTVGGMTLLNCARGQVMTTAAAHLAGASVYIKRLPMVSLWPVPDQGSTTTPYYTLVYWRLRRVQDATSGVQTVDIPFRFVECLVAGLAFRIGSKLPEVPPEKLSALKIEYEQQFALAAEEDREKATLRIVPR